MKEDAKEAINLPIKKDEFSQKRRVGWAGDCDASQGDRECGLDGAWYA